MQRRTILMGASGFLLGACAGRRLTADDAHLAATPRADGGGSWAAPGSSPSTGALPIGRTRPNPGMGPRSPVQAPIAPGRYYTVRPGETLTGVARRSGCSVQSICKANRLRSDRLDRGQVLWIPCDPQGRPLTGRGRTPAAAPRHRRGASAPPNSSPRTSAPHLASTRLVRRASWGAAPLGPNHDPMRRIRRITLHHTDEVGVAARGDLAIVQAIQRYHQQEQGWADIGYHYLIGRDGRIYEGRPRHAQGAHSGGANNIENLGVALIGNFERTLPPPAQIRAAAAFLDQERRSNRVATHQILGHRDLGSTICPGDAAYRWLQRAKTTMA